MFVFCVHGNLEADISQTTSFEDMYALSSWASSIHMYRTYIRIRQIPRAHVSIVTTITYVYIHTHVHIHIA